MVCGNGCCAEEEVEQLVDIKRKESFQSFGAVCNDTDAKEIEKKKCYLLHFL
jgi:hypothetical protein